MERAEASRNWRRLRLFGRGFAWIGLILAAKAFLHGTGREVLSVSPLLSGVLAATVFLLGFLVSGVLTDYKESEKLPAALAASLEALVQQLEVIRVARSLAEPDSPVGDVVGSFQAAVRQLAADTLGWLRGDTGTGQVLGDLDGLTPHLAAVQAWAPPPVTVRLLLETASLRGLLLRIDTIRSTRFAPLSYGLARLASFQLLLALVLAHVEPFAEALFFLILIASLLVFLLLLIEDLDNPFGHGEDDSCEDVSLAPLERTLERMGTRAQEASEASSSP